MKRSLAIICCFVMLFTVLCPVDAHFHAHAEEAVSEESNCSHRVLCTNQSLCIDCGQEATGFVVHDENCSEREYISDDTYHWYVCVYCHDKEGMYVDTHYTDDCSNPTVCAECGHEGGEITVHHNYPTEYAYDESYHWEVCSNCGELCEGSSPSLHSASCSDPTVCRVCNAQDIVVEEYELYHADTLYYNYDENGHWQACETCGQAFDEPVEHSRICGTDTCFYCGATGVDPENSGVVHNYDTAVYGHDEYSHWETCATCQETQRNVFEHEVDCTAPTHCTFCGADEVIIPNDQHLNHREWVYTWDENEHWQICADCGVEDSYYGHTGHDGECAAPNHCETCGADNISIQPYNLFHPMESSGEYASDEYYHWEVCVECGGCAAEYIPHSVLCTETDVCTFCGYTGVQRDNDDYVQHGESVYSNDETCHWYACADCGQQQGEKYEHRADCTTPDTCYYCNATGVQCELNHQWSNDDCYGSCYGIEWRNDDEYHWKQCYDCGAVEGKAKHVDWCDEGDTCEVCYASGVTIGEWKHHIDESVRLRDDTYHWYGCYNCDFQTNKEEHTVNCSSPTACLVCYEEDVTQADPSLTHEYVLSPGEHDLWDHYLRCIHCNRGRWESHKAKCNENVCEICGETDVEINDRSHETTYTFDEDYHNEICTLCGEEINSGWHQGTCLVRDVCRLCGATSEEANVDDYNHGDYEVTYDQENHYDQCIDCGEIIWQDAHIADCFEPELCTYCHQTNVTINRLSHSGDEWEYTYEQHWNVCSLCGEYDTAPEKHYDYDQDGCCDVCYQSDVYLICEHEITYEYDSDYHWGSCTLCGEYFSDSHIAECSEPEVCVVCGISGEDFRLRHTEGEYTYDDLQHRKSCTVCGVSVIEAPHRALCISATTCMDCGAENVTFDSIEHPNFEVLFDNEKHWKRCVECETVYQEELHRAACYEDSYCWDCNAEGSTITIGNPVHEEYEWRDSGDGTHRTYCLNCNEPTGEPEAHFDNYNDGLCDLCEASGVVHEHVRELTTDTWDHWYSCALCGERLTEYERHYAPCTDTSVCMLCGYENGDVILRHNYEEYSFNDWYHWSECADCGESSGEVGHTKLCTNPDACSVCGSSLDALGPDAIDVTHSESYNITFDEDLHYNECADCGERRSSGRHYDVCTDRGICAYCNATDVTFDGTSHNSSYQHDDSAHWTACNDCGEVTGERETHSTDCYNPNMCINCGAENVTEAIVNHYWAETGHDDEYHWDTCIWCGATNNKEQHVGLCNQSGQCEDCGAQDVVIGSVRHTESGNYEGDDTYHWMVCEYCDEIVLKAEHTVNCNSNVNCLVCGAGDIVQADPTLQHHYSEEWNITDYYDHGKTCSGCDNVMWESHRRNCDGDTCLVCGIGDANFYEESIIHEYDMSFDANYHQGECVKCGKMTEEEQHYAVCTDPNTCVICGGEGVELTYTRHGDSVFAQDPEFHGNKCADCGEWFWTDYHIGSCLDKTTCHECGATGEDVEFAGYTHPNYEYTYDNTTHYATCVDCGAIAWSGEHYTYCDEAPVCSTCGAENVEMTTLHYSDYEYEHDDQTHWFPCTRCDGYDYGPKHHRDMDENGVCDVCDATDVDLICEHQLEYRYNESRHWQECVLCDGAYPAEEHYASCDNPSLCLACGSTQNNIWDIRHTAGEYMYDENYHSVLCIYCNELMVEEAHFENCLEPGICAGCGATDANIHDTRHDGRSSYSNQEEHGEVCSDCNEIIWSGEHYNYCHDTTVCSYCGEADVTFYRTFHNSSYQHDDSAHWSACNDCGEVTGERETHCTDCYNPNTCFNCGAENVTEAIVNHLWAETGHDDEYHWDTCVWCGATNNKEQHVGLCNQSGQCEDCGAQDVVIGSVRHTESGNYEGDDTYHWMVCEYCDEIVLKAEHTVNCNSNVNCLVCGAGDIVQADPTLQHHYSEEWNITDYYDHGKTCSGCDNVMWESHRRNCDGDTCLVCGIGDANFYEESIIHEYDMSFDANYHQGECVKCGKMTEEEQHYAVCTDPNTCVICGGEGVELTYTRHGDSVFAQDPEFHGNKCADCGEWFWTDYHIGSCLDKTTCHECGATGEDVEIAGYTHPNYEVTYDNTKHYDTCVDCGTITWSGEHYTYCDDTTVCRYCDAADVTFADHYHTGGYHYEYNATEHQQICNTCEQVIETSVHSAWCTEPEVCGDCGATDVTIAKLMHDGVDEYLSDDTYHWQNCSICGQDTEKKEHTVNCSSPDCCLECAATGIVQADPNLEHVFPEEHYLADEGYHYYRCEVCGVGYGYGHTGPCDGNTCDTCGETGVLINQPTHEVVYEITDDRHTGICSVCGILVDNNQHFDRCDAQGICYICGATDVTFAGTDHANSSITWDDQYHYDVCDHCGEIVWQEEHCHECYKPYCQHCRQTNVTFGIVWHISEGLPLEHDDTHHWEPCSKCGDPMFITEHAGVCSDPDHCIYCGADGIVIAAEKLYHDNSHEEYRYNETEHWRVCGDCDLVLSGGFPHYNHCGENACAECGAENVVFDSINHHYDMKFTETYHWEVCDTCGIERAASKHCGYCDEPGVCSDCGATDCIIDPDMLWHSGGTTEHDQTHHWEFCGYCNELIYKEEHVTGCENPNDCWYCGAEDIVSSHVSHDVIRFEVTDDYHQAYCDGKNCQGIAVGGPQPHYAYCLDAENGYCYGCDAKGVNVTQRSHYEWKIMFDDEMHWRSCIDCFERIGEEKHYHTCENTTSCGYCGLEGDFSNNLMQHPFDKQIYEHDEEKHWVICGHCGLCIFGPDRHYTVCNDGNICQSCDLEFSCEMDRLHNADFTTLQHDETTHWRYCTLCDVITVEPEEHYSHCQDTGVCSKCGLESATGFPVKAHTAGDPDSALRNATHHWWMCEDCGEQVMYGEHIADQIDPYHCRFCYAEMSKLAIVQQPVDVAAQEGELAEVSFEAQGTGLTYTWYYKNAGATTFSKTSSFDSNRYFVEMNESRNGRQVYCVVTDQNGNTVQTDTVTLTMVNPVKITQQPTDAAVLEGETAEVSFAAEGDGLVYAWYYKNAGAAKFSKTSSFDSNLYFIEMNETRDGRQVYCVVTDKYGNTVQTDTVTLTMLNPVRITEQPVDAEGFEGETVEVSFTAEGDGLTYAWYYKNAGAAKFSKTSTFTGNTYTMEMTAARDGRQVYCVVTDQNGSTVQTDTVTLTMLKTAKITQQPVSVSVAGSETAEVSFTAEGDGLTYAWYYKNAGASKFTKTSTFTGNTYTMEMNATRDGRQIYCVVTDQYGNSVQTNTVTLSMLSTLKITSQPADISGVEGETVEVSFTAEGAGLTYTWYYKNAGAATFSKTSTFTGNTYSMEMNATRDGRQIYCVVTDQYGNTVQTDTVTLTMKAGALKITKQLESATAANGETVAVSFTAEGEGLTYAWYYKNAGAATFSKTSTFTGNSYSMEMNATRNGRQIYCVVTDKYGNTVQTDTVTLTMESALKITQQPVSVAVASGATANVSFTAEGEGLTYTWYYKDAGKTSFSKTSTFTGNSYSVAMTAARDGRQIYCVVKDQNGNTVQTDTVTLTMQDSALKITKQPVSVAVASGETAKVSFTAEGEGLTYTWYYKDAGKTSFSKTSTFTGNSYSVAMTAARDGRQIYCVVKDQNGNTVQTDTVTLSAK